MPNIKVSNFFPQSIGHFQYEGDLTLYKEEINKIQSTTENCVHYFPKELQWQSSMLFFNNYSFFNPIKEYLENNISSYFKKKLIINQSWVNIFFKYGHSLIHHHSPSQISGVLYLNTYEGDTFLFHNNFNPVESHSIPIKTKDILFFKGDQLHSTLPNISNQNKILIAFNMKEVD